MSRYGRVKNYLNVEPKSPFPGAGRTEILIDGNECENRIRAELVELTPQEAFPAHVHPKSDHVIIIVQGDGYLLLDDEERKIIAGDTFVVPRGKVHSIKANNNSSLRFVVINVPPIDFHHPDFMQPVEHHDH